MSSKAAETEETDEQTNQQTYFHDQEAKEKIAIIVCFPNEDDGEFPMELITTLCGETNATFRQSQLKKPGEPPANRRTATSSQQTAPKEVGKKRKFDLNVGELMQDSRFVNDHVNKSIEHLSSQGQKVIFIIVMPNEEGIFPQEKISAFCQNAKASFSYSYLNIKIRIKKIKTEPVSHTKKINYFC